MVLTNTTDWRECVAQNFLFECFLVAKFWISISNSDFYIFKEKKNVPQSSFTAHIKTIIYEINFEI